MAEVTLSKVMGCDHAWTWVRNGATAEGRCLKCGVDHPSSRAPGSIEADTVRGLIFEGRQFSNQQMVADVTLSPTNAVASMQRCARSRSRTRTFGASSKDWIGSDDRPR